MPPAATLRTLRKRAEFLAAAKGRKWAAPALVLYVMDIEDGDSPPSVRFGVTATRRSVGNAVARNRAKRRLRALARSVLTRHALPGRAYVLVARAVTTTCAAADLRRDLEKALKKTGAWRESEGAGCP